MKGSLKGLGRHFYLLKDKRDEEGVIRQKVLFYIGDRAKLQKFHKDMGKCLKNSENFLAKNLE